MLMVLLLAVAAAAAALHLEPHLAAVIVSLADKSWPWLFCSYHALHFEISLETKALLFQMIIVIFECGDGNAWSWIKTCVKLTRYWWNQTIKLTFKGLIVISYGRRSRIQWRHSAITGDTGCLVCWVVVFIHKWKEKENVKKCIDRLLLKPPRKGPNSAHAFHVCYSWLCVCVRPLSFFHE